ncbi:centromere protein Q [Heptranchias perlo]|uniref:centromere protein Q n=1 Tax=Heptranchias perlo TaxID=212740 RepID=UPI00355967B7
MKNRESIAAGKASKKAPRSRVMKPRKTTSKTTSRAAEKEDVEMEHRESEPPVKKQRTRLDAPNQMNRKQKVARVSAAKAARWKPLPQSTRDYIAAAVNIAMYNSLPQRGSEMEASQEHLVHLRRRFLARCSSIKVPVGKLKDLKNLKKSYELQKDHLREDEATLQTLQDELEKTLESLEQNTMEVEKLQDDIKALKDLLDETGCEELQNVSPGVLNVPELPQTSFQERPLQEKLADVENRDDLLKDLQTIRRSSNMQNLLAFLEGAHAEADKVSPLGSRVTCP